MQFAQKRLAEIAIDLYAMMCTLSRLTAQIESKGGEACEFEIALTATFFNRASKRIEAHFLSMDRNDDEIMKYIAEKSYELGKAPFDIMTDG
jgi:acyl-CoA dehydrogenase family protein 9